MKLYHSSNVIVESPDTLHSRNYLDFGRGFYLTSLHEQAVRYAQRFKRRGQQAWLNTYEFSIRDESQWSIMRFDTYDKNWLEFVTFCISKLSILLKLPQKEIYGRLKASGILYEYIVPSYDVLHTFSSRYLMEDLTEYMREKGVLEA